MTLQLATSKIKRKALDLGFSACGVAKAEPVDESEVKENEAWLERGFNAGMDYLNTNKSLRYDPRLLQPGAKSLVVVAMNYYPEKKKNTDLDFAYYSYGQDYHYVVKKYLSLLYSYIKNEIAPSLCPELELDGRAFTDSAPLMERYWAKKAGVGFVGRNSLIVVPRVGSFCFLGILALNVELSYDSPLEVTCGSCHICEQSCPTGAISNGKVDSNKCISYQTIENRSNIIPVEIESAMGHKVYGCDCCQIACPWNKFAKPTQIDEFKASEEFLSLDSSRLDMMKTGEFKRLFGNSSVVRAGLKGLRRNLKSVKKSDDWSRFGD